jgi:Mce-associated membrane protein
MRTARAITVVAVILAVGVAAAAVLVVHLATRSTSVGTAVVPKLEPSGIYTTGSIPSSSAQQAVAAANREVPDLLSYDYRDLSSSLSKALDQTTGDFRSSFERTFNQTVRATAATDKDVATSSVRGAAYVSSGTGGTVTCLLFVDQTLIRSAAPTGTPPHQVDEDRVVVTMTPVGHRWLISALTPV